MKQLVIKKMTDEELIDNVKELYDIIYNTETFGVKDMALFEYMTDELDHRGYSIMSKTTCVIWKDKKL